jgi:SAM-dependent methyltransferase
VKPETIAFLTQLNHQFYSEFGSSFAATRRRVQDGVKRVIAQLPDHPQDRWLDLGCGSGSVAVEWLNQQRQSHYQGLDFSETLLNEARSAVENMPGKEQISFSNADLSAPDWQEDLQPGFVGVMAFASLHHIPSQEARIVLLQHVRRLLQSSDSQFPGLFIHSEWQFQNSPKLWARRLPWETVGLSEADLEPGDTLLDWRSTIPGQPEKVGLRYVHLFNEAELTNLALKTGFTVRETFESDGLGSRLGLYQIWEETKEDCCE